MRNIKMTYHDVYYYCNIIDNLLYCFTSSIDWISTGAQYTEPFYEENNEDFSKWTSLHGFCDFVIRRLLFKDEHEQLEKIQERYDELEIANKEERLKRAFNDSGSKDYNLEVDNIFKIYRIPHEPFFSYLITHEVESFVDAYDDFTMYDDELDDAIEHLSRELFYILFQNRMFLYRFNSYMANANPTTRKRCYIPKWVKNAVRYRDRNRCVCCGKDLSGGWDCEDEESVHFDHMVSLCAGGLNDLCNIQLLCSSCNIKKSDGSYTRQIYKDWYDFEG